MSVIVPVRDRRDLLRALLDGLAASTYEDFEVIVVDDGSSDGSAEEAEAGADAQGVRGVRVLRQANLGAVAARNAGIAAAGGAILAFTDSDCVPEPGWLRAGVDAIDAGADVVAGHTRSLRPRGPLERGMWVEDNGLYPTCNVFYRREAFEAAGGFDGSVARRYGFRPGRRARGLGFGEDTLLGWRVRRTGRAAYAPDAVVLHQVLPPDFADLASRALQAAAFPALVREVPELRSTLLVARYFLGSSRLPLWGALASAAGRRSRLAMGFTLWWMGRHWRSARRLESSRRRCLQALPALLALDVLTGTALVAGSARARKLVL